MYQIKPLEWIKSRIPYHYIAHTIFGEIHIDDSQGFYTTVNMMGVLGEETNHKDLKSAKKYAESWYHNRLREALIYVGTSTKSAESDMGRQRV